MDEPKTPEELQAFWDGVIASDYPGGQQPTTTQPTRVPKRVGLYPWKTWQNGEYHVIMRGEDFDISVPKMQMQVYHRAQTAGLVVKTERLPNEGLGIMFAPNRAVAESKWRALAGEDANLHSDGEPPDGRSTKGVWIEVDE